MTNATKLTFDHLPDRLEIPEAMRDRRGEVIIILDDDQTQHAVAHRVWPVDFFEKTAGMWAGGTLVRGPQGEYERRQEIR